MVCQDLCRAINIKALIDRKPQLTCHSALKIFGSTKHEAPRDSVASWSTSSAGGGAPRCYIWQNRNETESIHSLDSWQHKTDLIAYRKKTKSTELTKVALLPLSYRSRELNFAAPTVDRTPDLDLLSNRVGSDGQVELADKMICVIIVLSTHIEGCAQCVDNLAGLTIMAKNNGHMRRHPVLRPGNSLRVGAGIWPEGI